MAGRVLELRHPPSLSSVTVHVPAAGRKAVVLAVFMVLHAVALKACIDTSGDAYEAAVQRQRRINREHHLNGTKPEDLPPQDPLPSTWAPNSWASAALFASISLHVFFHLLCHWKVSFEVATLFTPASRVREGCFLQVTPHAHRGKAALVPLWQSESSVRLVFIFQRQRYEYWEPEGDEEVGDVRLVECPVQEQITTYMQATGLRSNQLDDIKDHFGENRLQVEMPSFFQCYKEQLVSPLVIFQVFVALLWAADDFVQYTLMQLMFIGVFESTSVFQRLRTMKMLNSMGTKPYGIKVYRNSEWMEISTAELLPGDIVELMATPPIVHHAAVTTHTDGSKDAAGSVPADEAQHKPEQPEAQIAPDIVPCDCVIIRGEAVVSEASLTGESAPQMKDALLPESRALDLHGADRVHCLFSGTRLLRASEGGGRAHEVAAAGAHVSRVPPTPDGGCLCYVLRTGFASSQGELLQMIEFSQERVHGDTKEVMIALLVLLCFALVAAGYVLKTGLEKGEKTPHELLIKCVIILTAVVPRQLPMQMAVAVNTALMALLRNGVYCTEPFRVPLAGKLTHCLFDKTGTLTTDTLVPVSVVNCSPGEAVDKSGFPAQREVHDASPAAAIVLAVCHSLVAVEGRLSGDPIEVAALEGVGWRYDAEAETASPAESSASGDRSRCPVEAAKIVQRFHFASQLQRMAVVAEVRMRKGASADALAGAGRYALVKGSPEALRPLLADGAEPAWFEHAHTSLAESGLRVLALAYRRLGDSPTKARSDEPQLAREDVECSLSFAGLIAFECKSRADSGLVIGALVESDHRVAMLTGDSPLTALHVARACGIVTGELPGLLLKMRESDADATADSAANAEWVVATGERRGERLPLSSKVADLAASFALMATGDALEAVAEADAAFWAHVDEIRVFARMTPQGKATVIRELQRQGRHVLMCGDGGNDVGALKQADVGLALLAGYGNVNTTESLTDVATATGADAGGGAETAKTAEQILNDRQAALAKRSSEAQKARAKFMSEKQKELNGMHKQWLEEEVEARVARGENSIFAQAGAVKVVISKYQAALRAELKEYDSKHGNVYDGDEKPKDKLEEMQKKLESAEAASGLPMVRPGDASVAAPFTSKAPSVKNCVDLIRQGRCTLLSALQQQQIMMLNCIINAYVLSALSLEGSRSSERQMMASQWLLTTASVAFAYASPCDRMHPVRPLRSLFHPAVFVSMLGQAAIHLACMVIAVRMARSAMEEGSAERQAGWSGPSLKDVSEFWRVERLKRRGYVEREPEEEDWTQSVMMLWAQPFLPNLMNTVVFLVETAQTVAILFVNYKGQPWMKGVTENRALFLSVFVVAGSVAAAAWEFSPELNALIHLSPFPNDHFRWSVMGLVGVTLVGTLVWDRLCIALFAPEIFRAILQSAKATTFQGDILPIFKTAGKVLAFFFLLGTGNLLIAGGAYWWYRRQTREVT